jgi:heat shock protein HtpX
MFNTLKTALLLGLMTTFFLLVGRYLGGTSGMAIALVFATVTNLVSWWFSDTIVLAMHSAKEANAQSAPRLYGIVADLARRADLPMPRVFVIPQMAPNAFATGRGPSHAAVAVTEGLLQSMDEEQIAAVLAHELGHVARRDTLTMAVAASMAGGVSLLADMARWSFIFGGGDRDRRGGGMAGLFAVIVAPLVAMLLQLAISRSREYAADAYSARIMGSPEPLIRALRTLEAGMQRIPAHTPSPAVAPMYIISPNDIFGIFRTHPRTEDRIQRLMGGR